MWTRIGRNIVLFILMVLPIGVFAEDISFEATVNANQITMQDMVELTLSVQGASGNVPAISLPVIEGFDSRFEGPSTKLMIVNGVSSSEHAFIYDLFPTKVGHFQIPSLTVVINGKEYKTTPIDIDVTDKPAAAGGEKTADNINEKVFMQASLGPKEVYVGEKTPLTMKVFVKDLSLQLASVPYLNPEGFTADATANMQKGKDAVNGVAYDSLTFDTNIYPTQSGQLTIGPFKAQGELVYRTKRSDDILGDLFAETQTRPITLQAPAVTLNVLALPTENRPASFSGAVGQYDFKASVGPSTVKVGDPLTLHMSLSGQGHLKDVAFPAFHDSRFKTYDPQIKSDDKSKTFEQVIIPTSANITEVPALSFSYFDPKEKQYKTITQGPFPIKVTAPSVGEEFKAYGFIDKTKPVVQKPFMVKGVRSFLQNLFLGLVNLLKDLRFWLCLLMVGIVVFGFYMWREFQKKLESDTAFSRRWKADAKVKEFLATTKSYLEQNNSKEFYRSLYKTVNDYLADKMDMPLAGLTWPMIEDYLKEHSADASKLMTMKKLFERCELVRFASARMPMDQMTSDYNDLQDLVAYLSKLLK